MVETADEVNARREVAHLARRWILAGGLIMLVSLPFVIQQLSVPLEFIMFLIIVLDIVSGVTNALLQWVAMLDTITCALAIIYFEYYAVSLYLTYGLRSGFFYLNELLAVIFFFALYFSAKTLRKIYTDPQLPQEKN